MPLVAALKEALGSTYRCLCSRRPQRLDLFDLPAELRLLIYEYAMLEGSHISIATDVRANIHPLLRTNRQIRREAEQFAADSTFVLSCDLTELTRARTFVRRFNRRYPSQRRRLHVIVQPESCTRDSEMMYECFKSDWHDWSRRYRREGMVVDYAPFPNRQEHSGARSGLDIAAGVILAMVFFWPFVASCLFQNVAPTDLAVTALWTEGGNQTGDCTITEPQPDNLSSSAVLLAVVLRALIIAAMPQDDPTTASSRPPKPRKALYTPETWVSGHWVTGYCKGGKYEGGYYDGGNFEAGYWVDGGWDDGQYVVGQYVSSRYVPLRYVPLKYVPVEYVPGSYVEGYWADDGSHDGDRAEAGQRS